MKSLKKQLLRHGIAFAIHLFVPVFTNTKSILASLLLTGVFACTADDGEERFERQDNQLQNAPVALSQLAKVSRVSYAPIAFSTALNTERRLSFVSGDLGETLAPVAQTFKIAESNLRLLKSDSDNFGGVVEHFEQSRNGLRVVGGDLRVTRNSLGKIIAATGSSWGDESISAQPSFDSDEAGLLALASTAGATSSSVAELVYIAPSDGSEPRLAWTYFVTGTLGELPVLDEVFVDAHSGIVVDRHPHIHRSRDRDTYNANGQQAQGTLARSENTGATGNTEVDQAHDAAGVTYDCFQSLFSRDSYDGQGATMSSIANFGQNFQNAYWDSQNLVMVYGAGFAVKDVGTHEVGHAVTTTTADLVYQNEPGALNEAWSDIFSAACDAHSKGSVSSATWSLGEEMQSGAFRFMANPTNDGYSADYYPERLILPNTEDGDYGGVHGNSGIANLAFYLLSQGGTHPRNSTSISVTPVGIDKAGQVFYRALTGYMNTNTDFAGARAATEAAAAEIYGENSSEVVSVSEAWFAVGVGGEPAERIEEPEPEEEGSGEGGGNGTGEGGEGGGGGTGGGEPYAGDVTGGCSTGGTQSPISAAMLLLFGAFVMRFRRRQN